jgi:hypothetical protein
MPIHKIDYTHTTSNIALTQPGKNQRKSSFVKKCPQENRQLYPGAWNVPSVGVQQGKIRENQSL